MFAAGHRLEPVTRIVEDILRDGGRAEAAEIDALDERVLEQHLEGVIQKAGKVDVS